MVDKDLKYSLVSSILIDLFVSFKELQLVNNRIEVDCPARERYIVIFSNSSIKITFSYTEKNIREEVFDNFNIMISKDEYNGFDFPTYLKTIGIKNPEEKMKLINYEGDFKERLEKFCEFVKGIFSNQLSKVISGEDWINVGFDWSPYK